jgi:hypothetical protein
MLTEPDYKLNRARGPDEDGSAGALVASATRGIAGGECLGHKC